jgi:hypothetical protein
MVVDFISDYNLQQLSLKGPCKHYAAVIALPVAIASVAGDAFWPFDTHTN